MSEIRIVVGLSGVGKSTVLEKAMQLSDTQYEIMNYGDRMLAIAQNKGLVEDRDELRTLDAETQKRIQLQAAEEIVDHATQSDVLIETHAIIKTSHGYLPGLPRWTIENLNPTHILEITADAEEIRSRRMDDPKRARTIESVKTIGEQQELARAMLATGAVLSDAYLKPIPNKQGEAEQTAEELITSLQQ